MLADMPRYDCARWVPANQPAVPYTGGPRKVVHHKTQVHSENASALYGASGAWPHFTVGPNGVQQHFDTAAGSRALVNAAGGVQTNADSAIQIEVVGFSGERMPDATLRFLVTLLGEIERREGIPWAWPEGRPPTTSQEGYGTNTAERHASVWDSQTGHYGHSQVPENSHWDPAYTDEEWYLLNLAMVPAKPRVLVKAFTPESDLLRAYPKLFPGRQVSVVGPLNTPQTPHVGNPQDIGFGVAIWGAETCYIGKDRYDTLRLALQGERLV
jgi:hypothetical protein